MADPWLSIIGLGEDGPAGLTPASRAALETAEIVTGPARHLALVEGVGAGERRVWPVPFADGIAPLMALKGRRAAMLVSGDPFWFGAGAVITRHLAPGEWRALPGVSSFARAAAVMGWAVETTVCVGLHAAPLARLRPEMAPGARVIALLRDGAAVGELGAYLSGAGFGESRLTVMERLGGPWERVTEATAEAVEGTFAAPVCAAIEVSGGEALPRVPGRADTWFDNDGQITRAPVRAMTLAALAPSGTQHLWDIGAGSGSVGIEWLLAGPHLRATAVEPRADRAARIVANAAKLGVDRLRVVTGRAPEAVAELERPDAVFVGGGLDVALLDWLQTQLSGVRLVANAVTVETEALLIAAHARLGGEITRIELSSLVPLGPKRGWRAGWPITQWAVML